MTLAMKIQDERRDAMEKGRVQGREEGRKEERRNLIRILRGLGHSEERIHELTRIPMEEINRLDEKE